jgi:hypothetical protein
MSRAALAALVLAGACTSSGPVGAPSVGSTSSPAATAPASPAPPDLVAIAASGSPEADGIRLAADHAEVTIRFVDPNGDPEGALRDAVAARPPAVVIVRSSDAVVGARPEIEAAAVPVIDVGGDLYSDRLLFRYAFQVSTPLRWQARVLAHYLVTDRGHDRIAVRGPRDIGDSALAEEGTSPVEGDAQAVLALGRSPRGRVRAQLAVPGAALDAPTWFPPGTVACAPYTWAGWAEAIPRVGRFRARFLDRFGREPGLAEQEGYEAVRAVAEALERTEGRGGDALVRALESFRDETFTSTPIRLGPDDHVFAEESHLGLFAVEPPGVRAPGEDVEPVPWRPVMRTFTTNGKRVNLTDRDVRVFFPAWRPPAPRPNYWRSRFGIVSRPDDAVH